MTLGVDQDVVVVPVLYVEVVLNEAVPSQTLDEVGDAGLPVRPKDLSVDVVEAAFVANLFEVANGAGVVDELDQSAVAGVGHDVVGPHPDLDVFLFEDIPEEGDQLHSHVLLPQIVTGLHHEALDLVTLDVAVDGLLGDAFLGQSPLLPEIAGRQNKSSLRYFLGFLFELWLLAFLQLEGILKTDRLEHQLEGHSFLGAEGEAVVDGDAGRYTRLVADREGDAVQVLPLFVEELIADLAHVLSELVIALGFVIPFQLLWQVEQFLEKDIAVFGVVGQFHFGLGALVDGFDGGGLETESSQQGGV